MDAGAAEALAVERDRFADERGLIGLKKPSKRAGERRTDAPQEIIGMCLRVSSCPSAWRDGFGDAGLGIGERPVEIEQDLALGLVRSSAAKGTPGAGGTEPTIKTILICILAGGRRGG